MTIIKLEIRWTHEAHPEQGVQAEITLASPRARASGIHEHSGVSTRNTRAQTGEPHLQLESNVYASKDPQYVSGYDARRRHETKQKVKQLVPVYNLEHKYNKGYFRKELQQIKEQEEEKKKKELLKSGANK